VRRALAFAAVAALVGAAPAAALLPKLPSGSVVGGDVALKAYASLMPPVTVFGDALIARVAVVADTRWVDPSRLRVTTNFAPYAPTRAPTVLQLGSGRFHQVTWTWHLRCLTTKCIPGTPPNDTRRVFHFRPARIDYLATNGRPEYGITARFPPVVAFSEINPSVVAALANHNVLRWQYQLAPVAAATYRLSPGLLFWLALALAGILAALGITVAGRWALGFRKPAAARPVAAGSTVERALAVFFWAREHGDETLQRKALERVADELPIEVHDLSDMYRELAWSPETPEDRDVQAISEGAPLPTRPDEEDQP